MFPLGSPCEHCGQNLLTAEAFICTKCSRPQKKKVIGKLVDKAQSDVLIRKTLAYPQVFGSQSVSNQDQGESPQMTSPDDENQLYDAEGATVGSILGRNRKRSLSSQAYPQVFGSQSLSNQDQGESSQKTPPDDENQLYDAEGATVGSILGRNRKRSSSFSRRTNPKKHFKNADSCCSDGEVPKPGSLAVTSPVNAKKSDHLDGASSQGTKEVGISEATGVSDKVVQKYIASISVYL